MIQFSDSSAATERPPPTRGPSQLAVPKAILPTSRPAAVSDLTLSRKQADALQMLKRIGIAPLPKAVLHGQAIYELASEGLIERTGIDGFWAATDLGKTIDHESMVVDANDQPSRSTWYISPEPDARTGSLLEASFSAIDGLRPGDELFGRVVRGSALERLSNCSSATKFIYFAYPVGFALKHIAWAVRGSKPLWTEHHINVYRYNLGLPATRWVALKNERDKARVIAAADDDLRKRLLTEGCEPWEIEEYFAVRQDRRPVL